MNVIKNKDNYMGSRNYNQVLNQRELHEKFINQMKLSK